ncbi:MAG: DNA mismatch repair endonuclease MutL [Bacteroidota bacterium]
MPDIIKLLPDSIANQIAAGEVVQRPASAVKELMENAIDAGATSIQLIVREAGKTLLQVIDNGMGMSETDARLSLERHATSKIRTAEDLFALRTMGFRGEALASIAAVSQMEMKTRQAHHELGTLLQVEASEVKRQEPVVCDVGTNISVKNLFFNIPARRNFLKSNTVEMRHIVEEFQRLALAHPSISFQLIQGDEQMFDLPPGKLSQRIVNVFGKNYQQHLAPVSEETETVKVSGYVGKPESARKSRGEQFLFVNQRYVRSNYLNHAVAAAFDGLISEGSFPFFVIFIDIDPRQIDVNVHPTKTEIKFSDERSVYAVVSSAVRQALGAHNLAPAIDFAADVNIVNKLSQQSISKDQYFDEQFGALARSNLDNWEKMFVEKGENTSRLFDAPPAPKEEVPASWRVEGVSAAESIGGEKISFQLQQKYLVKVVPAGLMIIDQQAAHERVLYEKYLTQLKLNRSASQQCLFPQAIPLPPADFTMIMEMEKEMKALGFQLEVFGKNTVLISGVPAGMQGREKEVFEGLLEQFKLNQAALKIPIHENLARALARRTAVTSGQKLAAEAVDAIITGLFACTNPNFSPGGTPTFFIFDTSKMESYFR